MISHHSLCPWIATTSGEWRGCLGPFMTDCHLSPLSNDFLAVLLKLGYYLVDLDAGFLYETGEVDGSLARAFRTFL